MDKFFKGLGKICCKIGASYKKISKKDPRIDTVVTISGVLLFSVITFVAIKSFMAPGVVDIATNKAEAAFYERNYDIAIAEYEKLQEDDEWPIWKVKIAEIYSVKGEYEKSNSLLDEACTIRNSLVDSNGKAKYNEDDKDGDLGNYIAFTYLMNGEHEKALEYGEFFMKQNVANKKLARTMVTVYMTNGEIEKAKGIIEDYRLDKDSAYDLALYARMNMLLDDWDKGFEYLKEAWYKDKDEIKVFDVIAQTSAHNKDDMIQRLSELVEKNPDEVAYKVWLTKAYSMIEATSNEANILLEEIKDEDLGNTVFKTVIAKIYQHTEREDEAEKILSEISKNEDNSFIGYHTAAWYYLENGDPEKAFELCKNSILANKDYPDNYGFLIPEIMIQMKQNEIAEPYLRTAIFKEPFNYNIILKIADYYWYTTQNSEKAYEYFKLASSIKPNDAEILYNMALINLTNGNTDLASEQFKKCISLNETVTKYNRTLGTIYLNEGKTTEAIKYIRAAYAVDKSDILTLNNAGCYYIAYEGDIERGMTNLKAAFDGLGNTSDLEVRNLITENYNKAKELFDAYNKNDGATLKVPEFQLFY